MPVERRERVIAIWLGSTGNGRNPMFNGRRQPSRGGTSRMTRECQVRFCESLGGKIPRASSANCHPPFIPLFSPPTNSGHVSWPTRLTKGMTPLAHPQEMPEISIQLGAWIRPPPPHHLSNIPSSPAAISGPLRPSLRRLSVEGTRQVSTRIVAAPRGCAKRASLQVHEPSESPAAITTQPLVSAANTAV